MSWYAILLPMIPVRALTFWIVILCGIHAIRWTMVVMRNLFGGGVDKIGVVQVVGEYEYVV
jgi:hypothetical protein